MNKFNKRSWLFLEYLVNDFFEFIVVHELALVHELIEFMTVYEQPMFMNKVRVHDQNKFMISWTFIKVSFVVQEYSWTVHEHVDVQFFVHENSWTIHECSWTVHDHLTGDIGMMP